MNLVQFENILISASFWSILAASALFLGEIVLKQRWMKTLGIVGMGIGLVGSIGSMAARYVYAQYPPLSNLFESLIFLLFGILLIYLIAETVWKPRYLGAAAAPLAFLVIGFASILPARLKDAHPLMPALQSYWLKIHVSLMLLSYAAFFLAFGAAVIYLILWYGKGKKELGGTTHGMLATEPPTGGGGSIASQLAFFDEMTYRLVLVGFPTLATGIIMGGMWANHAWGTYWSWDPKETWALITWLVYGAYLHARLVRDWRDHKAAWLCVVGFVSVLVTYLGVNYLAQGLHTYGSLL